MIYSQEKESIKKIEKFFSNCRKILIKNKIQKMIYKLKSMKSNIMELPEHILIVVMEYFSFQERFKYHTLNKEFCKALH